MMNTKDLRDLVSSQDLRNARELVEDSVSRGRDALVEKLSELLSAGQDMARDLTRARRQTPDPWVWFALGMATVVAGALLRKPAAAMLSGSRGTVGDVMVKNVETVESTASVIDAAQRMRDANVGVLPVVEGGRLRGIVTDRDLVTRGMARGTDPFGIKIGELATRDFVAARPDWSQERAMDAMTRHHIGRLPVVDDNDRVIGIVTLGSLALRSSHDTRTLDTAREVSRRAARPV
jgi:CBS domain-containing protein